MNIPTFWISQGVLSAMTSVSTENADPEGEKIVRDALGALMEGDETVGVRFDGGTAVISLGVPETLPVAGSLIRYFVIGEEPDTPAFFGFVVPPDGESPEADRVAVEWLLNLCVGEPVSRWREEPGNPATLVAHELEVTHEEVWDARPCLVFGELHPISVPENAALIERLGHLIGISWFLDATV